jgi:hypothetical protein
MRIMSKIGTSSLMICLAAGLICSSPAAAEDLSLQFEGENFSAHVEDSPLKVVADRIEKEKGIWFKAGEVLMQKKVFADFDDLPLEQGLEVILSRMNYSLVFDGKDEIVGVFLFKSLEPAQGRNVRGRNVRSVRRPPVRSRPRILPRRNPQPFRN